MKRLYALDIYVSESVPVINFETGKEITNIYVGSGKVGGGIAISPNGNRVYITTSNSQQGEAPLGPGHVLVATPTGKVITRIRVGDAPGELVVTPNGNRVWVANHNSNSVSVINTHTNKVIHTLRVGKHPSGIAVTPNGKFVWVTNYSSNTISVFRTRTKEIIGTIPIRRPTQIVFAPNGQRAYVNGQNGVIIIDVPNRKVIGKLPVSGSVAVTPDSTRIIVGSGTRLYSINASTNLITRSVTVNIPITDITISENQIFIGQVRGGGPSQITIRNFALQLIRRVFRSPNFEIEVIAVG